MKVTKTSHTAKGCESIRICWLLLLIAVLPITNPLYGKERTSRGLETVVIDAGHGGKDPGAVVGKAREKDIVLEIALRLGKNIRENLPDVKVIFTRSTDVFVPLFERSVIANKNNADLFISIHANFCSSPSVKGTETYVLGLHRTVDNLNVAKKENSVILLEKDYSTRYEGFDPNLSESYIMFELIQNTHIEQSVAFAGILQDFFREHAQRASRDVRQAGFLVLRETAMPSVLIETGYLSNKSEASYLMTTEGRAALASSIYNSFKSYKEKFESRLNLGSARSSKGQKVMIDSSPAERQTAEITKEIAVPKREEKSIRDQNTEYQNLNRQEATADEITFAIQLAANPKKLSLHSQIFKGIQGISEIRIGGYYKYYCLETTSPVIAKQNMNTIRKKIPDAFIVAFKNGEPIPMKEAMKAR